MWRSSRPAAGRKLCVRNGGALILQPHIRHAGDAGTARARFAKLLSYVAILPWVEVPHLASFLLSGCLRRLRADWQCIYGQDLALVETFIQKDRFDGRCYAAANWICVGQSQGRGRNDRFKRATLPLKTIWLYPLRKDFHQILCA